jgi:hypothetical protein
MMMQAEPDGPTPFIRRGDDEVVLRSLTTNFTAASGVRAEVVQIITPIQHSRRRNR